MERKKKSIVPLILGMGILVAIPMVIMGYLFPATDPVLDSLGKWEQICLYNNEAVQDFTYYGKFSVTDPRPEESRYFQPVNENIRADLLRHLEDYEGWIDLHSQSQAQKDLLLAQSYDFDRGLITEDDWAAILDDPKYPDLGNYDIYFLDWETQVVYYFHNNI